MTNITRCRAFNVRALKFWVELFGWSKPTARSGPLCNCRGAPAKRSVAPRLFAWNRNAKKERTLEEALKRVVAYVRTSSRDDAEAERSLDAQEKVCSELAQENCPHGTGVNLPRVRKHGGSEQAQRSKA